MQAPKMHYDALEAAITEKTKAIIPIDYEGSGYAQKLLCNYRAASSILGKLFSDYRLYLWF